MHAHTRTCTQSPIYHFISFTAVYQTCLQGSAKGYCWTGINMTLYYTLVRNRIYVELWGRKGKCLSTTLTAGLPKVFLRAALIFIKLSGAPLYSCIGNNWRLARLVRRLLVFWMHLASLLAGKPWILYAPAKGGLLSSDDAGILRYVITCLLFVTTQAFSGAPITAHDCSRLLCAHASVIKRED